MSASVNHHTRTPEEDGEVTEKLREWDQAKADEDDAASRLSLLTEELADLGVDVSKIRSMGA